MHVLTWCHRWRKDAQRDLRQVLWAAQSMGQPPWKTSPESRKDVKNVGSFPTGPQSVGEYWNTMMEVHFGRFLNAESPVV